MDKGDARKFGWLVRDHAHGGDEEIDAVATRSTNGSAADTVDAQALGAAAFVAVGPLRATANDTRHCAWWTNYVPCSASRRGQRATCSELRADG